MKPLRLALLLAAPGALPWATHAQTAPAPIASVGVFTQRNDNARSGANLREARLNTSNVQARSFGKLWTRQVDGEVYAQPLYVPALKIGGKTRNVLFVATEHNSVYAFDADDPEAFAPLWTRNFGPSVPVSDIGSTCGAYRDMSREAGITGTPVIDPKTNTLYVVARTKPSDRTYHQHLHALDLMTGHDRANSPVEIRATMKGSGAGNKNGVLSFDPLIHNQRASLLLLQGTVYIAWASHCDTGDYHGWVLGYDAHSLEQTAIFNTTPNGWAGGIWQSGTGLSADAQGNLYMAVGNGTFTLDQPGGQDIGDSFIKVGTQGVGPGKQTPLQLLDSFTPHDQAALLKDDADLGSTGALLLHDERLVIGGNKRGTLFALSMDKLGGYNAEHDNPAAQSFAATPGGHLHGTPIYWKSDALGPLIYAWGEQDFLKVRRIQNSRIEETPLAQSDFPAPPGMPGGFLSLSALGGKAGTGILWASLPADRDANQAVVPGVLRAFDASNIKHELWNSLQNAQRDDLGNFPKFCQPTVVDGHVYMATFSGQVICYGLNPPALLPIPSIAPPGGKPGTLVSLVGETGAQLRYTLDGSDPSPASPLYASPLKIAKSGQLRVRAFKKGGAPSPVASALFSEDPLIGTGDGLSATYFTGKELAGTGVSRVDATLDARQPAPELKLAADASWSARWTGQIEAQFSGEHTISTVSDDGVRVWLNDRKIIDDWGDHAATQDNARVHLERGKRYNIKVEFYNAAGVADCHLLWSPPNHAQTPVPQSQLYSH